MGLFDAILNFVTSIAGLLKKKGNISQYLMVFLSNIPALVAAVAEYKEAMTADKIDEAIAAVKAHMISIDLDRDLPADVEAAFIDHALAAAAIALKHGLKVPGFIVPPLSGVSTPG